MKHKTTDMHLFPTTSLQWSRSGLNAPIHIRISEAEVCFYLMTLAVIHAVQLHMVALVHGELCNTQDRSLHSRTKALSMYKTQCSNSSYWTCQLHQTCHCVLTAVTEHVSYTEHATVFFQQLLNMSVTQNVPLCSYTSTLHVANTVP
jgi:hypothetical protein